MTDRSQRWNTWAGIATVAAALIAAVTFLWGAKSELDAARAQTLASALQIVQAQTQLAVEHPDLAMRDPDDRAALDDPRYIWFATNALMTADTVYALVGDTPEWRSTASTLIQQHLPFVLSPKFPCQLFNPAFLRLVRESAQEAADQAGVAICPGR
jgi:hypothetical protein